MKIRFPPIASIRAFEAAARHLNFTRAAEELHITQSAISHQIKHIEELWGFILFNRNGRSLVLSNEAQRVLPIIERFLNDMQVCLTSLAQTNDGGVLHLGLSSSFALKWMVPKLGDFRTQFPDIEVYIMNISENSSNFKEHDLAIIFSDGQFESGLTAIPLLKEFYFAVCSPTFYKRHKQDLNQPENIVDMPLLRRLDIDQTPRWRDWFAKAGIETYFLPKGVHYPDSSMALQAAIDDQGIALARSAHVAQDIQSKRLMKLFDISIQSDCQYYLVVKDSALGLSGIADFIGWLKDQAEESQQLFIEQAKLNHLTKTAPVSKFKPTKKALKSK